MSEEFSPFRYKLVVVGTNTTRENVSIPRQPEQYEHIIESVSLENATSATTYARLFTTNGVEESFHREWRTLSAANLYYDNTLKLPVLPEEIAGVAFFGITAADVLSVYIRGRRRKIT